MVIEAIVIFTTFFKMGKSLNDFVVTYSLRNLHVHVTSKREGRDILAPLLNEALDNNYLFCRVFHQQLNVLL